MWREGHFFAIIMTLLPMISLLRFLWENNKWFLLIRSKTRFTKWTKWLWKYATVSYGWEITYCLFDCDVIMIMWCIDAIHACLVESGLIVIQSCQITFNIHMTQPKYFGLSKLQGKPFQIYLPSGHQKWPHIYSLNCLMTVIKHTLATWSSGRSCNSLLVTKSDQTHINWPQSQVKEPVIPYWSPKVIKHINWPPG